ncbi:uncharacterized protein N7473_004455 [Penicillium subrubescens]|uniref:uncharacterized protein n=1 Tax=Penicillium subrubescens TaxID=1316194 RepID=UPI00254591DC|nr:uncharacterized protein N7473_004455 [Penicillium subrubescens]KAJ5900385.1 hypothetical protein N7473_004455 [Penicillium subrubescens]
MGSVRKSTGYSSRRPDFRRQLQCALSLSSFETEEQYDSIGHSYEDQIDPALFPTTQTAEKIEEQTDLLRDRDMIALECVAELGVRMKNVEDSMNNQENVN